MRETASAFGIKEGKPVAGDGPRRTLEVGEKDHWCRSSVSLTSPSARTGPQCRGGRSVDTILPRLGSSYEPQPLGSEMQPPVPCFSFHALHERGKRA
jgi:hypothetical protein